MLTINFTLNEILINNPNAITNKVNRILNKNSIGKVLNYLKILKSL